MAYTGSVSYRHIRCFLEVARLSSVGQAATALAISQPAVSKTLRELEDRLGRRLFERSGRRLRLNCGFGCPVGDHACSARFDPN